MSKAWINKRKPWINPCNPWTNPRTSYMSPWKRYNIWGNPYKRLHKPPTIGYVKTCLSYTIST